MAVAGAEPAAAVTTKLSSRSVSDTVARAKRLMESKGVKIFAVIDQREQAQQVGLDLRETQLILFGNPRAGTPVMDAVPLSALDLPLKILVWSDAEQTKLSYTPPSALAARYELPADLLAGLAVIDGLTDAIVAEEPQP
jgi:uncharacterized protein (DUF302 family)